MKNTPEQLELFKYLPHSYKHSYQDPYNVATLVAQGIREKGRMREVMHSLCDADLSKEEK